MGEAYISRAGSSKSGEIISNKTKDAFGFNNDATLDDILQSVALKDPNYATILCTLQYPDGTIIQNEKIKIVETGGSVYNYTTNELGQCIFKTNKPHATVSAIKSQNINYFDLTNSAYEVDCYLGSYTKLNVKLSPRFNNTDSMRITMNQNIKFSNFINSFDINIGGAGGSDGGGWYWDVLNFNVVAAAGGGSKTIKTYYPNYYGSIGFDGEIKYMNNFHPESNRNYICMCGRAGNNSWDSFSYIGAIGNPAEYSKIWFNTNIAGSREGFAGGTTSFDKVLAANGGAGGRGANRTANASGSISHTSYQTFTVKYREWKDYGGGLNAYIDAYENSYGRDDGYIQLSNFQYKI